MLIPQFQSEMEHCTTKTRYKRTNKTRNSTRQLTVMEGLGRQFKAMSAAVEKILTQQKAAENPRTPTIARSPSAPYEIAEDTKHQVHIIPSFGSMTEIRQLTYVDKIIGSS